MKSFLTPIADLIIVEKSINTDSRGAFSRMYCSEEFLSLIGQRQIVQINHSRTAAVGAIRGLHFQHPPYAEVKIVQCIKGRVWDVAVDLRANSPTFLTWHSVELSAFNSLALIIPEGVAHVFQVLEPDSELLYMHTNFYIQSAEGGVRFDDPRLAISWPLPITEISKRDASHDFIGAKFSGVTT